MGISCVQLDDAAERNNLIQMISDLRDSEAKLVNILESIEADDAGGISDQVTVCCVSVLS